jgi:asparaginyl-tRNA synthetase
MNAAVWNAIPAALPTSIRALMHAPVNTRLVVNGWVRNVRRQKRYWFAEIADGSSGQSLQIVAPSLLAKEGDLPITPGSCIKAFGVLQRSHGTGQELELLADDLQVTGPCDAGSYPIQKQGHSDEFLRTQQHFRLRTERMSKIMRLKSKLAHAMASWLHSQDFVQIYAPSITEHDCEGGGEAFTVSSERRPDFFPKDAYLTVSAQLHLEIAASSISRVFSMAPVFRAENHQTSRHLAEFWMLECEMAFCDTLDSLLNFAETFLRESCGLLSREATEMDDESRSRLLTTFGRPIPRISYADAVDILAKHPESFEYCPQMGRDLQSEHEKFLCDRVFRGPVFVTDYPAALKPFYMKLNPDSQTVACADLLLPGMGEVLGGSLREDRAHVLKESMERKLSPAACESLQWYLDLRKFGCSPHGGFGLGFDRLLQFALSVGNIRDVVMLPRTAGAIKY